ncbi:MAG: GNAT family N-acetyltransferase [archaeon]|nr:MAG: GNAT family N-acetyltransferase [archaeon]
MKVRRARRSDVPAVAELIVRTKRLNNEFDPLFALVPDAKARARKYATSSLTSPQDLLLVATDGEKVVGVIRAELRERIFYKPHREGLITDFYILPEFRRKALGAEMLQAASRALKKMGAEIIVGEVPSRNEIAMKFYAKRGFRPLVQLFGTSPQ